MSLIWKTEQRKVKNLIPYEYNPRKMSAEQMKHLRESLEEFGMVEIPAINEDGILIAGHQRCAAMIALGRGEEMIDVRVPNMQLSEKQLKKYNFNSNAIKGDWVDDILRSHFEDVIDFADYGMEIEEIGSAHAALADATEEPEMPIVGKFSEKYTSFVVVCVNEIDENHIAEKLGIERGKSYKGGTNIAPMHVIHAAKLIESWK
jgi:ParB-like chromosome segregation protein Spo0J